MVAIDGKTNDLRELSPGEPQISLKVPFYQTAPVTIEKSLRRSAKLKRNPEANVYHEEVSIAESDCSELDPSAYNETMTGIGKSKWIKAMNSEMESIK